MNNTDQGCRNLRWALALLDGLVSGGLRRLVFSPGSRSTPLLLAAQRQPLIELTPIVDERSAAFFALGLARAGGRPVGVLCTSGSALAHWFPAVIEAYESEIPLILLSADRPPELRGWGANQTIDQTRLFGGFVREFHDPAGGNHQRGTQNHAGARRSCCRRQPRQLAGQYISICLFGNRWCRKTTALPRPIRCSPYRAPLPPKPRPAPLNRPLGTKKWMIGHTIWRR